MPWFGESAVLINPNVQRPGGQAAPAVSNATVTTRVASQLLRLSRDQADDFLRLLPQFAQMLRERRKLLQRTNPHVVKAHLAEKFSARLA